MRTMRTSERAVLPFWQASISGVVPAGPRGRPAEATPRGEGAGAAGQARPGAAAPRAGWEEGKAEGARRWSSARSLGPRGRGAGAPRRSGPWSTRRGAAWSRRSSSGPPRPSTRGSTRRWPSSRWTSPPCSSRGGHPQSPCARSPRRGRARCARRGPAAARRWGAWAEGAGGWRDDTQQCGGGAARASSCWSAPLSMSSRTICCTPERAAAMRTVSPSLAPCMLRSWGPFARRNCGGEEAGGEAGGESQR